MPMPSALRASNTIKVNYLNNKYSAAADKAEAKTLAQSANARNTIKVDALNDKYSAAADKAEANILAQSAIAKTQIEAQEAQEAKMQPIPLNSLGGKFAYANGVIDVVKNYPWTLTPPSERIGVPYIELIEFEQSLNTMYASIEYWSKLGQGNNPYEGLYLGEPTGTRYILPYFENFLEEITQSWTENGGLLDVAIFKQAVDLIGMGSQLLGKSAATSINTPKSWQPPNSKSFPVTFTLFNTINKDYIVMNYKLINRLRMSALHDQIGRIEATPPALFEVNMPGLRISSASVISNLSIQNVGQINYIEIQMGEKIAIPDAWIVNMTLFELIPESRQILDAALTRKPKKVRSIISMEEFKIREKEADIQKATPFASPAEIKELAGQGYVPDTSTEPRVYT